MKRSLLILVVIFSFTKLQSTDKDFFKYIDSLPTGAIKPMKVISINPVDIRFVNNNISNSEPYIFADINLKENMNVIWGDPAQGQNKELIIEYKSPGKADQTLIFKENSHHILVPVGNFTAKYGSSANKIDVTDKIKKLEPEAFLIMFKTITISKNPKGSSARGRDIKRLLKYLIIEYELGKENADSLALEFTDDFNFEFLFIWVVDKGDRLLGGLGGQRFNKFMDYWKKL